MFYLNVPFIYIISLMLYLVKFFLEEMFTLNIVLLSI